MTKNETLLGDLRGGLCSSGLCKQLRSVAADEIERLQRELAVNQEFHNIDDVVEIRRLTAILDRNPVMLEGKHMGGSDVCVTCAAHCVTAEDDQTEIRKLRAALSASRGQWIHSVNARQCLEALGEPSPDEPSVGPLIVHRAFSEEEIAKMHAPSCALLVHGSECNCKWPTERTSGEES